MRLTEGGDSGMMTLAAGQPPGRRPGPKIRPRRGRESRSVAKRSGGAMSKTAPSCEDCFFNRNQLCALELDEPCATFRPDRPEGLVPPRQPVLLMREPR